MTSKTQEPELVTIEQAAATLKAPLWAAASLKARHRWPINRPITVDEYAQHLKVLMHGHSDGSLNPAPGLESEPETEHEGGEG